MLPSSPMEDIIKIQGRTLTISDIEFIKQQLTTHPSWGRYRLSQELCRSWHWTNAKGEIKDMACRTMLLKLEERGYLQLPPRQKKAALKKTSSKTISPILHSQTPINEKIQAILPLRIQKILPKSPQEALYNYLLSAYHYLGYKRSVGENMKYLIQDNLGRPLACLLFGSSAWSAEDRDMAIGWNKDVRQKNLNFTTNNTRFLILPWVRVPHLASYILSLISKRVKQDWIERYGHPVYLLETFVERDRFVGTCYKAANWKKVGQTKGRTRNDRYTTLEQPIKDIYLYPLVRSYQKILQNPIALGGAQKNNQD